MIDLTAGVAAAGSAELLGLLVVVEKEEEGGREIVSEWAREEERGDRRSRG